MFLAWLLVSEGVSPPTNSCNILEVVCGGERESGSERKVHAGLVGKKKEG